MARAKADPKFGEIFLFDTPVLMWDQHFSPETWDRLKTRHVPYGWQGLSHAGTDPAGMGVAADGARGVVGACGAARGARGARQKGLKTWGRQRSPAEEPGTLISSHSASQGVGRRGRLCKCRLLHLVTFSPNKSSSVCMIINWGRRSSDNPLHCCGWRLFPFLAQTHSLLSPAAAGFNPSAGKCWGWCGGVNWWQLQRDIVRRGHGQHGQQRQQSWGWRCPDASSCLARPQVAAVWSRLRNVGGCEGVTPSLGEEGLAGVPPSHL